MNNKKNRYYNKNSEVFETEAIAAEVICRPDDSIGRLLQTAKNHLETAEVFAYTVAVILLSVLLEHLLLALAKHFGRRFNAEEV